MKSPTNSSIDSLSDYEPIVAPSTSRRGRSALTMEERRQARAHRNRLAAQLSRNRRKAQFRELESRLSALEEENLRLLLGVSSPSTQVDRSLVEENTELHARVRHLEQAWGNLARLLEAANLPIPLSVAQVFQPPASIASFTPNIDDDPLSRATCEPARFSNTSLQVSLQRVAPSARVSVMKFLLDQKMLRERRGCLT